MRPALLAVFLGTALLSSCSQHPSSTPTPVPSPSAPQELTVRVEKVLPADRASFTQGLEVAQDNPEQLIVGTGWQGESRVYRRDLGGHVLASASLKPEEFGEGITQYGDKIWQLTWQNGVAYQRDAKTLQVTKQAHYSGEGWGLCSDGTNLIMSDGSRTLRVLDPETFQEKSRITTGVDKLNELECADGAIYANRFMTTEIVKLSPQGDLLARIDASSLPNNAAKDPNNVLNGIAKVPGTDHFYLTGKRWPDMYEVRFEPKS